METAFSCFDGAVSLSSEPDPDPLESLLLVRLMWSRLCTADPDDRSPSLALPSLLPEAVSEHIETVFVEFFEMCCLQRYC